MTSRVRVLRIITRLNIGGPAIHTGVLTTGVDPQQFDTRLVVGRPGPAEGDMTAQVVGDANRITSLHWLERPLHPVKDAIVWWQLVRLIRQWRPHIIHTHMAKAGALGRSAARATCWLSGGTYRPVVMHTFHGHVLDGYFSRRAARFFTFVERRLTRWTNQLIAVSPAVRDDLVARGIAPLEKIAVIPLGLPLEPFLAVNGTQHIWRTPREHDTCVIGWAGRLVPIKQVELLFDGLAIFRQRAPSSPVRAIIAGDGELRAVTERAIIDRGLADCMRCVGWVREMSSFYADMDVVCLTSVNEGTPVSLIEAMAAGRPVVATAVGGVPDVLGVDRPAVEALAPGAYLRGDGGLLVRAGDAEAFAAALAACAADPELRHAMGRAGRERVRERYAAARLLRDINALYQQWLAKPSATTAAAHRGVACAS